MRAENDVAGRVIISAPISFGMLAIVPELPKLFAKYPSLLVDLRLEDQLIDLVGEGVDLAVRAGVEPPDSAQLIAHTLFRFRRWLVASPAYLRRNKAPGDPTSLERHVLLVQLASASWSFRFKDREIQLEPRAVLRANTPLALRDAALAGVGIALLPEWLVKGDVAAGRLKQLLPEAETAATPLIALHRTEHRSSAKIRAVVDHLRGAVGR